jgi:hypothetical protein
MFASPRGIWDVHQTQYGGENDGEAMYMVASLASIIRKVGFGHQTMDPGE